MVPLAGPLAAALMDFSVVPRHIALMSAILFDTLRLSRTLREKGHFTPEQAETLAALWGQQAMTISPPRRIWRH